MKLTQDILNRLQNNDPTLTSLDLSKCGIGDGSIAALAEALKKNNTVVVLDLQYNKIGSAGLRRLAQALQQNRTLTTLYLCGNRIGDHGIVELVETLSQNKTLTTLTLSYNKIGPAGAKALARLLRKNNTLATLFLGHNSLSNHGIIELAKALCFNKTLTSLSLDKTETGIEGAKALATMLEQNFTLRSLYLQDNCEFNDLCVMQLAESLKINYTLNSLCLVACQISNISADKLIKLLEENYTLIDLTVNNNSLIDINRLHNIERLVKQNKERQDNYFEAANKEDLKQIFNHLNQDLSLRIKNPDGKTILDIAIENNQIHLRDQLLKKAIYQEIPIESLISTEKYKALTKVLILKKIFKQVENEPAPTNEKQSTAQSTEPLNILNLPAELLEKIFSHIELPPGEISELLVKLTSNKKILSLMFKADKSTMTIAEQSATNTASATTEITASEDTAQLRFKRI